MDALTSEGNPSREAEPPVPSLPTTEISADEPFSSTHSSDTTQPVGQQTRRMVSPDSYSTLPSGIWTRCRCR